MEGVGMGFKNDNQVRFPVEFLPKFTNDSAEQEQPLRDCPSQRFNKPDSYHNLFIVSWITRVCVYRFIVYTSPPMEVFHHTAAGSISCSFRIDLTSVPAAVFTRALRFMPSDEGYNSKILPIGQLLLV
ncbi:hypothetical protein T4B_832 [Trichinella pseudospiralis]|uniref:Uncharacterized protein n=1 Tax=Trichinella pseudospiralis TaxID=6337 RepID=A0A0V1GQ03_TRIPS|nr:hypothetical protein T4B_832 [Trichinella pseudospiralis]